MDGTAEVLLNGGNDFLQKAQIQSFFDTHGHAKKLQPPNRLCGWVND